MLVFYLFASAKSARSAFSLRSENNESLPVDIAFSFLYTCIRILHQEWIYWIFLACPCAQEIIVTVFSLEHPQNVMVK